jgi:aminoglycoside phosphotransferase (APT) family kinase protein
MMNAREARRVHLDRETLAQYASTALQSEVGDVSLELQPFRLGLEASVARVVARAVLTDGRARRSDFVVKRLSGRGRLEAAVHAHLTGLAAFGAPQLLAVRDADASTYLFLEYVRPAQSWPWRDVARTALVLERLAQVHTVRVEAPLHEIVAWDYELALRRSALETLDTVDRAAIEPDGKWLRPARRTVYKAVTGLTSMRAWLLDAPRFGTTLLHGDVHTGNVRLRARHGQLEVVLLDWGRARLGSPLEDVASWLLSLGCWEPEARRRHDTLLQRYLSARRLPPVLDQDVRRAYWLAAASNALAGALKYQVAVAVGWTGASARTRRVAAEVTLSHIRALRRALAFWAN